MPQAGRQAHPKRPPRPLKLAARRLLRYHLAGDSGGPTVADSETHPCIPTTPFPSCPPARRDAPAERQYTLLTNRRSQPPLVQAVSGLFARPQPFLLDGID